MWRKRVEPLRSEKLRFSFNTGFPQEILGVESRFCAACGSTKPSSGSKRMKVLFCHKSHRHVDSL